MAGRRRKDTEAVKAAQRAVTWATTHGAPVRLLEGWDPDTGLWADDSPVGRILHDVSHGAHVSVASRRQHMQLTEMLVKGRENLGVLPENRDFIPVDIRIFQDLVMAIEEAEAEHEIDLVSVVDDHARKSPHVAMQLLSRRYPDRWREQQQVLTTAEVDERDIIIGRMIENPNVAMQLASLARAAEVQIAAEES